MKSRNITILVLLLLVADQVLKIWVKTHMAIGEAITVFPDWFQLRFIENNGAAFGMHISSGGGLDWGKLALSLFRVVMVVALGFLIRQLNSKKDTPKGVIVGLAMIMAGAIGYHYIGTLCVLLCHIDHMRSTHVKFHSYSSITFDLIR